MQARFYVPWFGRFASPDPARDQHFEDTQSWNIYSYVRNSPVMSTDPTGMVVQGNRGTQDQTATQNFQAKASNEELDAARKKQEAEKKKKPAQTKKGGKGLPKKVEPKNEKRAKVIFGETRALTPQKDEKGRPLPSSELALANARSFVGAVSEVNSDVHSESEPNPTNPSERKAWNASATAADFEAVLPAGVQFFFLRQDGVGKQGPTQKQYAHDPEPVMSFGPFVKQWGGGDVPKGNAVYIDFYKVPDK